MKVCSSRFIPPRVKGDPGVLGVPRRGAPRCLAILGGHLGAEGTQVRGGATRVEVFEFDFFDCSKPFKLLGNQSREEENNGKRSNFSSGRLAAVINLLKPLIQIDFVNGVAGDT